MNTLIENLINGNVTLARKQAKRFAHWKIRLALMEIGWSLKKATFAADWLKGRDCWQDYCDAE